MKTIRRKKNGGVVLIQLLENGFDDLVDGDEYICLGKHNRILNLVSDKANNNDIGKIIWDYKVKDRKKVIGFFDIQSYVIYKDYFLNIPQVKRIT